MNDRPVQAWMAVLDRIEEAVRQSLARAADPPEPARAPPAGPSPVERLAGRLGRWGDGLSRLEAEAEAAARELDADEEALAAWADELRAVRAEGEAWLAAALTRPGAATPAA